MFLWLYKKGDKDPGQDWVCDINQSWLLSLLLHQRLGPPHLSSLHFLQVSLIVSWLATATCFPFAPLFPLVWTFLSVDWSIPAVFLGFVFTLKKFNQFILIGGYLFYWNFSWAISNPKRWCCESAALNTPANLENSAVATGLEKVSFHSNSKERQCQRRFKLPHNCTHLTR